MEVQRMKITSKGQVTIPVEVREQMGFLPNSEVEFVVQGNVVILQKATGSMGRGKKIIERMRGRATIRMSTDDIMALTRG
jgi:antitoxin PrlF